MNKLPKDLHDPDKLRDLGIDVCQRYGISIQSYGSPVYVKAVKKGASDPSVSSTLYTWPIPAGSSFDKKLGCNLDVWVQTAGNYSAQEWV